MRKWNFNQTLVYFLSFYGKIYLYVLLNKRVKEWTLAGTTAAITWKASDGADSYDVYVNGVKVNTEPITGTSYTITGLASDSTYEVTVKALNRNGESEQSLVMVVQTAEVTVKMGDADGDGNITQDDALKVLDMVAKGGIEN